MVLNDSDGPTGDGSGVGLTVVLNGGFETGPTCCHRLDHAFSEKSDGKTCPVLVGVGIWLG